MRGSTDKVIHQKYDKSKENDLKIIQRVAALAEKMNVSMTEISLAWLLHKGVCAPIVGATKISHFDDALKAVDLSLDQEAIEYLEELYKPHEIVGANKENQKI